MLHGRGCITTTAERLQKTAVLPCSFSIQCGRSVVAISSCESTASGNRHAPRANAATSHHIQTAGRRAVVRRPCAVLRKPPRSPPASANANANARARTPTRSGRALWRLTFSGLASVLAWHWRRALFIRLLLICHVLLICLCPLRGAPHSRRLLLSLGSESSSLFPPLSGSTWSSPRFSFRYSQPSVL